MTLTRNLRFNLRILSLGVAVSCVAVTTLATQLSIVHIVVASIPSLIILAIATSPSQAKPNAQWLGLILSAFWAGGAAYKDASIVAVIAFSLSYAVIGYYTGEFLEIRRKKAQEVA